MPRKSKTETESEVSQKPMTKEEALDVITAVARGNGTKQQTEAAKEWLRINGAGDVYTKYVIEVVHTYKDKPKLNLPELKI